MGEAVTLSYQQAALETGLERIARIIARQMGIKVRIQGTAAYVNMKTYEVVLPATFDNSKIEKWMLHGLLDQLLLLRTNHEGHHPRQDLFGPLGFLGEE